jgi:hypothetical protein
LYISGPSDGQCSLPKSLQASNSHITWDPAWETTGVAAAAAAPPRRRQRQQCRTPAPEWTPWGPCPLMPAPCLPQRPGTTWRYLPAWWQETRSVGSGCRPLQKSGEGEWQWLLQVRHCPTVEVSVRASICVRMEDAFGTTKQPLSPKAPCSVLHAPYILERCCCLHFNDTRTWVALHR